MSLVLRNIFLALAAGVACFPAFAREPNYDSPQTKAFVQSIAANIRSGKLIEISSTKLAREYNSNEVVADGKYKNRFLFIDGTIDSVSKDVFENIVVNLRTGNQFLSVMARFDKTVAVISGLEGKGGILVTQKNASVVEAVSQVKRGSKVHLICRGDGFVMGIPQLRICDTLSQ